MAHCTNKEGFDIDSHNTIIVGWVNYKITYCRTFDSLADRESMMKAFNFVRENCDSYSLTSLLDELIEYKDSL